MSAATLVIEPLSAGDSASVEAAYRVVASASARDVPDLAPPSRAGFEVVLREPWPGEESHRWVARTADGAVVGYLVVELPTIDNLENSWMGVTVLPEFRRRGFGRALHEHALVFLRQRGRKRTAGLSVDTLPGGGVARDPAFSAFARAMGMTSALAEVRRRLDLESVDRGRLDSLLAGARAAASGYSLVRWNGATPAEHRAGVALLDSDFINQAPMGDLAWEAEKIDEERICATDEARVKHGRVRVSTAAVHDATGELVAWSALGRHAGHVEHADQGITLVHPAHRGHRLGLLTKIENLDYAIAEMPGIRYVDTWNAAVNKHMIAINEQLGFRAIDYWHNWQMDL